MHEPCHQQEVLDKGESKIGQAQISPCPRQFRWQLALLATPNVPLMNVKHISSDIENHIIMETCSTFKTRCAIHILHPTNLAAIEQQSMVVKVKSWRCTISLHSFECSLSFQLLTVHTGQVSHKSLYPWCSIAPAAVSLVTPAPRLFIPIEPFV